MDTNSVGRHANVALDGAADTLGSWWGNVRRQAHNLVSDEPPENEALMELPPEQGFMEGMDEMSQLTYQQRLAGFGLTLGMGLLFIFLALLMTPMIVVTSKKFAYFMTVGGLFCVCSTMFLVGCAQQMRVMFQESRFQAACIYVGSAILTLLSALWLKSSILCIVFACAQVAAILWYALSFVPYARHVVSLLSSYIIAILGPVGRVIGSALGSCVSAFTR